MLKSRLNGLILFLLIDPRKYAGHANASLLELWLHALSHIDLVSAQHAIYSRLLVDDLHDASAVL